MQHNITESRATDRMRAREGERRNAWLLLCNLFGQFRAKVLLGFYRASVLKLKGPIASYSVQNNSTVNCACMLRILIYPSLMHPHVQVTAAYISHVTSVDTPHFSFSMLFCCRCLCVINPCTVSKHKPMPNIYVL
jgi:hypothetical protein